MKVMVQSQSKDTHVIKPRILYIDKTGKYKSYEPEPATAIAKELRIKGLTNGER